MVEATPETPPEIPRVIMLFSMTYLFPALAIAVATGNGEFILYSTFLVVMVRVVRLVHQQCHLSLRVLWGLSLWGLAHMVGGLVPIPDSWPCDGPVQVVYSWWLIPNVLKYDQLVHVLGTAVMTFVCWQGLTAIVQHRGSTIHLSPTPGTLILCAAAAQGFGAFNEVMEFIATLIFTKTNVGGYLNTGLDLVSNLVGSLLAIGWLWWWADPADNSASA